ncbi:2-oxo-4-hydroxy-4-carboxy-5-ureidoimidazoline decarboxylase [Kocuria rosea]|jgi:2-oxo-4-hydroxy-4-carboxy-5-ureidoimidazoline decarboxylase|uniref:2-oxo-4-hydroxy-4-carboxy-5-ureidoimidazoline decarboxylase n=1 Tax=Kocuria rosea TaxID=1275 RepID=UPI00203C83D6|nr:2-oxo-4-hydroxy-4-carboxy-5-ureidoimidazoline decarboxylase [Kocuria rosea]MCM3687347.1 2-oxo-4-hydroxy-4-carboxy-5-ureidoimidazoline decarboxylase [Kocuria rosea]
MHLTEFNALSRTHAAEAVRPALDIPRWLEAVVDARPYWHRDALLGAARTAALPFTDEEIERALSHHPRIGERPAGNGAEAALSRAEQAAVDPTDRNVQERLREGNRAYEERFGRVFLIRAAGRTPEEILEQLTARLANDPATERAVVAEQLREIALLRLEGLVTP